MPARKAYVYFGIYGNYDPEAISSKISLKPDKSTARHSSNPRHQIPKESILHYGEVGTESDLIDVYDLAEKSVEILMPDFENFREVILNHQVTAIFQAVVYFPKSAEIPMPAIGFSKRVIEFAAAMGASIDIDSYRE